MAYSYKEIRYFVQIRPRSVGEICANLSG